ncbi:hypothetical protein IAT38_006094 [Cryptococcus sp. DSM 104549]
MAEAKLAAIDAQIAKLQGDRKRILAQVEAEQRAREKEEANILVQATPTKASVKEQAKTETLPERPAQPNFASASSSSSKVPLPRPLSASSHPINKGLSSKISLVPKHKRSVQALPTLPSVPASRLTEGLAKLQKKAAPASVESAPRSTSLAQAPVPTTSTSRPSSVPALSPGARRQASRSRSASLEVMMGSEEDEPIAKEKSKERQREGPLSGAAPLERYQNRGRHPELSRAPKSKKEQTEQEKAEEEKRWRERDKQREKARQIDAKRKKEEEEERLGVKREEKPTREDDMTVIERLKTGPRTKEKDPEGGDEWNYREPNSGINLRERSLAHVDLQNHLEGRFYLAPSKLYSVIRLSRDKTTYDVPVLGDWITIAVVAQRSDIRTTGTKDTAKVSDDDGDDDDEDGTGEEKDVKPFKGKGKAKAGGKDDWKKRRVPRKYVNLTLSAMPPRRSDGSVPGDSLLQLLLFEADSTVQMEDEEGNVTREYRGGSGGAYEKWCNLATGSVIAIMNPRVWRNLRGGAHAPHPLEFPLGLNPTSAESICLIGLSRDIGRCVAIQRDGNRCKSWIDTRQGKVCEYHIHLAVKSGRSKRAEFTASTSSMALMSARAPGSSKDRYDPDTYNPKNKTGLLPRHGPRAAPRGVDNGGGGATYIVGGRVLNTGTSTKPSPFTPEYLNEQMGRGPGVKRRRDVECKAVEAEMTKLMERDAGFGGGTTGGKYLTSVCKANEKKGAGPMKGSATKSADEQKRKSAFGVDAVRKMGFHPGRRPGQNNEEDEGKRIAIAALRDRVQEDKLGLYEARKEEERRKQEERRAAKRARLEGNSKPSDARQDASKRPEPPAPVTQEEDDMKWWSQGEADQGSVGESEQERLAESLGDPLDADLMEEVGDEWMGDADQQWMEEQELLAEEGQALMDEQGLVGDEDTLLEDEGDAATKEEGGAATEAEGDVATEGEGDAAIENGKDVGLQGEEDPMMEEKKGQEAAEEKDQGLVEQTEGAGDGENANEDSEKVETGEEPEEEVMIDLDD